MYLTLSTNNGTHNLCTLSYMCPKLDMRGGEEGWEKTAPSVAPLNALFCTKMCDSCMKSARIGGNAYARLQNQIMMYGWSPPSPFQVLYSPHTPPLGCSSHVDELPACPYCMCMRLVRKILLRPIICVGCLVSYLPLLPRQTSMVHMGWFVE